ncbi:hypothetical protein ABH941_003886 [Streptacidiphilus sp. EB103A]
MVAPHPCNGSVRWGELRAVSRARAWKEAAPSASTSCRGYPMRDNGRGRPGSGAECSPGARGEGFRACRSGCGEVQAHLGECWARSASRNYPRVRPDVPNDPVRGPFERFGWLLGGVTTTLGAVATIYGCNSPQHGCNSPQPGAHAPPRQETGAHPATHAPPTAPLLVVAARRSRATPARHGPACPTEATDVQREQSRTSETASGRGLGRGGVSPARSAWGGTPPHQRTPLRLPRPRPSPAEPRPEHPHRNRHPHQHGPHPHPSGAAVGAGAWEWEGAGDHRRGGGGVELGEGRSGAPLR